MARAIVLRRTGGPEVMALETVEIGAPGPGEVRLRQTAIGVNFHDAYVRSGSYQTLKLPGVPGVEAAGVIEAAGSGVAGFRPGDRVGYVSRGYGAYADERLIAADLLIPLPDTVSDQTAAATLVKGLTAWMLIAKLRPLKAGDVCLVHAAAGGVGRILTRWASWMGARVIGTVGDAAKAEIARADGCWETVIYREADFAARVLELTEGRGVDMVYDSVGQDTFMRSLPLLALRGWMINFGQSSGPVEPFSVGLLAGKSNTLTRPILFDFLVDPAERAEMAICLFEALALGVVPGDIGAQFRLADASEAHRAMEARATTGSTILTP
jgi:NADPH2:quinone reductase